MDFVITIATYGTGVMCLLGFAVAILSILQTAQLAQQIKERTILQLLHDNGFLYGLELVEKSNGRLKRGTIYVTLARMEGEGLIESWKEHKGNRRVYMIKGKGLDKLREVGW